MLEAHIKLLTTNTHKKALISNEIPTEKETISKTNLTNLDPLIIEKFAPK